MTFQLTARADYPLSSIITSEFATTKWRGAMMGAVFSMQGFGQLGGALIMLILVSGFKESLLLSKDYASCTGPCALAVDKMWRALIGTSRAYLFRPPFQVPVKLWYIEC